MELFYHEDIPLDLITDQFAGCSCGSDCAQNVSSCTCFEKSHSCYDTSSGRLINFDRPIFECNSECQCDLTCPNRIVQRHLAKLSGENSRYSNTYLDLLESCSSNNQIGQKLVARCEIQTGELVCVYLGEVIPYSEACQREMDQLTSKGHNYVLIMREYAGPNELINEICIDGDSDVMGSCKPLTRLINHSCNPNLVVMPVHVDNLIPYLALFACKPVSEGMEVTYNYAQSVPCDQIQLSDTRCLCGSSKCIGFLPRI